MKIIENNYLPPKGFAAINLFGVVFVRYGTKLSERTMQHEGIHTKQMREMLYIFFYLWYGLEWLFRLAQYRNCMTAYYNISFEREAYANDQAIGYCEGRRWWAWVRYIRMRKES